MRGCAGSPGRHGCLVGMTKLIVWFALVGILIGVAVMGAEAVAPHLDTNQTVSVFEIREGSYAPLTDSQTWWTQLPLSWWIYPLIGATMGAVVAVFLALAGLRVARTGLGD